MKRLISLLLCFALFAGLAVTVRADVFIDLGQTWDDSILAGGIYDLYAWVGDSPENYTFQWQADMGFGKGNWIDLEDNANPYGYSGTKTYHFRLTTRLNDGNVIGSGWDEIPFRCLVTHKQTGAVRGTASMFMKIFSSDDLDEYMAGKGVGLFEPSITGASKPTTTDGISYYAAAEAGKSLKLICGSTLPQNDPLMGRSDMEGKVEVWITENGKTVKREDGTTYIPSTIGKDAVTVEFKLHCTIGVHDLGYYDIKTLKLSTAEPTIVGRGTAKQEMSLLKEPYGQAQKLVTIPKGQTVHVHTNSGSWYQVSYNGYVGYVAGSSLNYEDYTPVIDHVNVTIAEPVAGKVAPTTCSVTPDSCVVSYVDWQDITEGRFINSGEKFIKGHTYRLVVWAEAKEGYTFKLDGNDKMLSTATVNDNLPAFTSRAYEQIIGKVMEIAFDFVNVKEADETHVCKLAAVAQKDPTCTQPGQQAYYKCTCGKCYADAAATQEVTPGVWGVISAAGHKAGGWTGNGTHHYKKCTVCKEVIPGTNAAHSGGMATCQQKASCGVCAMQYGQLTGHKWSQKPVYQEAAGHARACENPSCNAHEQLSSHTPGAEATETEPQRCTACQYILVPAKNHVHDYRKVEAKAAACLVAGNKEYYTCTGCELWWLDAVGKQPVNDKTAVSVPALGHTAGKQWAFNEETHWQSCIVCLTPLEEGQGGHCDEDSDGSCDVCSYHADGAVPTETTPPATTPPPVEEERADGNGWEIAVLVALVCFAAAVTATVIIVKKRGSDV